MQVNPIISAFLQALLILAAPFIVGIVVAQAVRLTRTAWRELKEHQPAAAAALEVAASLAVTAAEQAGLTGLIENKKQYALEIAQQYLAMRGIKLDLKLIDAAIESAVYVEINRPELVLPEATPGGDVAAITVAVQE